MNQINGNIEEALSQGLKDPAFDIVQDYAELGIDVFIDNDILKEIPIVKTIVGLVKGGIAVREIFLAKKLLVFLKEFHSGQLKKEKKDDFFKRFSSDKKYHNSVIEQIIVLNDRFINIEKSRVLSNLFQAHINGKFDWDDFCQLSEFLDRLHTSGFKVLYDGSESGWHFNTYDGKDGNGILFSAGLCIVHGNHYSVNAYGQYLYYYGIKGDINFSIPPNVEQ